MLNKIEEIFSCESEDIFILPSAKYYISKSSSIRKKYSQDIIDAALIAIENYNVIPDKFVSQEKFIVLSNIEGIDSGEQILFSVDIPDEEYLILTGDKRSLRELSINSKNISDSHKGKVVCLEVLLLELLKYIPFEDLTQKVKASNFCSDTVIRLCFNQESLTFGKVTEGLNSYVLSLKSETELLLYDKK